MLTAFRWITLIVAGLSGMEALIDDDMHVNGSAITLGVSGVLFLMSYLPVFCV